MSDRHRYPRFHGLIFLVIATCFAPFWSAHGAPPGTPPPPLELTKFVIEQMPGGTTTIRDGALVIEDADGCSVWLRDELQAPVEISYDVTVVSRGGPHDRVSDVNCFWMARDPRTLDGCPFSPGRGRSGKFAEYASLETYYVGMGGNENSTTRFRRYDGSDQPPLLPEHDLRKSEFLLARNATYHIRLVTQKGVAEYWRNDERLFAFRDPHPLDHGWFAFRTVNSHLEIRNFRVQSLDLPKEKRGTR